MLNHIDLTSRKIYFTSTSKLTLPQPHFTSTQPHLACFVAHRTLKRVILFANHASDSLLRWQFRHTISLYSLTSRQVTSGHFHLLLWVVLLHLAAPQIVPRLYIGASNHFCDSNLGHENENFSKSVKGLMLCIILRSFLWGVRGWSWDLGLEELWDGSSTWLACWGMGYVVVLAWWGSQAAQGRTRPGYSFTV